MFSLTVGTALAENLFDTLDDIKSGVEKDQNRVEKGGKSSSTTVTVVDFSKNKWGNLSKDLSDMLDAVTDVDSLDDIAKEAKYLQSQGNVKALTDYLKDLQLVDKNKNSYTLKTDEINLIINAIRFKGESQLLSVVLSVVKVIRNIIGAIAIAIIVFAGIQMMTSSGEESKLTEQKNTIMYVIVGLVAILLIERMIVLIYGTPGVERGFGTTGKGISEEMYGLISYVKAIVGVIAIVMIMVSGVKTIAAQGEEEKLTNQRKSIIWVVLGLVIIIINKVVVDNLYTKPIANKDVITKTNVQSIVNLLGTVTQFVLGFVGLIALAAFIYGATTMIANYGNDEMRDKGVKIIKNALIGIIVILSAFAIVSTVIKFG